VALVNIVLAAAARDLTARRQVIRRVGVLDPWVRLGLVSVLMASSRTAPAVVTCL